MTMREIVDKGTLRVTSEDGGMILIDPQVRGSDWRLALTPTQARDLGDALYRAANRCERRVAPACTSAPKESGS